MKPENIIKKIEREARKVQLSKKKKQELYDAKEWYTIRSLLGNTWANYFVLIGARERGKSFSVQEYCLTQFFNPKSKLYRVPFYWMRLNEAATKNMLMNNGAKMFEPLLVRRFGLEKIKCKGDSVFLDDGTLLCRVYGLSTAYNNKGAALFDKKSFKGVNIIIDEFALEKGQRRTFDVVYNMKMQIENICRSERENVRVFMIMNNTEECPAALAMFNFNPLEFGVYKLKRKHCIIDYIPNNKKYEERRKKALANELDNGTGNFTNKIAKDIALIYKGRLNRPSRILKFSKDPSDWYTIWDGNVICKYNGEKKNGIAMKRYIDDVYYPDFVNQIIEQNDVRLFKFRDLMIQTRFRQDLELIKK